MKYCNGMNQQTRLCQTRLGPPRGCRCGGTARWAEGRLPVAVVEPGGQQGCRPCGPQVQRAAVVQGLGARQRRGTCARRGPHPRPAVLGLLVRAATAPTLARQE